MAYTAGALATRVQKRIKDTGYSSSDIIEHLSDTLYDIYNTYPNLFPVQTSTTYTLAVNTADITNGSGLSTTFSQAVTLEITTDGYERNLPVVDFTWINENFPDCNDTTRYPSNVPEYAYWKDNTINVFPVPNTAYTVKLTFYKQPTELTAESDVPELPQRHREMLILGASYRALQIKDNYDQAGVLENAYLEKLQQFVVLSAQRFTGPKIMRVNRRVLGKTRF